MTVAPLRSSTRATALLALLAILSAACTSSAEKDPEAVPTTAAPSTAPADTDPVAVPAGDGPVQDVWVYERVRTVGDDGTLVDVTDAIVASIADDLDEPVELRDGVAFRAARVLDPVVMDTPTSPRDDLEVVAGLVETAQGRRLQVVATPTGTTSVDADDTLALDLSAVEDLAPGDPLVVDFTFGQALPAANSSEDDLAPLEQLAARMTSQRFQWYGVEGEDGSRSPGLLRVFGSVTDRGATAVVPPATSTAPTVALAVARPATPVGPGRGRARVHTIQGGPGLADGVPLKAKPAIAPVDDLAGCDDASIDCLKDYFKDMEDGFRESLEDVLGTNLGPDPFPDPEPRPDPDCRGACGGGSGEPHMKTFDGLRYDLQAVGEFVLASADPLTVQMRTLPWGDDRRVSVIGGIAVDVGGQRVTVQSGRDEPIHVDGEPLPVARAREGVDLDAGRVAEYGGDLYVTTDAGPTVLVHGAARGGTLDVVVDTAATAVGDWVGLLGDADGTPDDDRVVRDGEVLPRDLPRDRLYGEFADSWRISDDESLFDYRPGESTTTFTDPTYPDEHVTVDELPTADVDRARALCAAAGIHRPAQLDNCIFDVALTGDVQFVRSARYANARLDPVAGAWTRQLTEVDALAGTAVLDDAGHVLVPGTGDEEGRLRALDLATGEVAWQTTTAPAAAGCAAPTGTGAVGVLVPDGDGALALSLLDAADGSEVTRVPTPVRGCEAMVARATTVLLRDGRRLVTVDTDTGEVTVDEQLQPVVGPLLAGDGTPWVVTGGDQPRALQLDPADGSAGASVPLDGDGVHGPVAAGPDGLIVRLRGPSPHTATLQRVTADGVMWTTTFPRTVGEVDVDELGGGELAVGDGHVALYVSGRDVGILDLTTGEPITSVRSSSFQNNDGRVHLLAGEVVVGPFGSDHWVEALAIDDGARRWSEVAPSALKAHDVKMIGPTTPNGQVVVATRSSNGLVVAKVGPGR